MVATLETWLVVDSNWSWRVTFWRAVGGVTWLVV
jgi:hypothetical protein